MRRYPFLNKSFLKENKKVLTYVGVFTGVSILFLIAFLFVPELIYARPGGGQSYSGGGSSGGGGGDGIVGLIIWLLMDS